MNAIAFEFGLGILDEGNDIVQHEWPTSATIQRFPNHHSSFLLVNIVFNRSEPDHAHFDPYLNLRFTPPVQVQPPDRTYYHTSPKHLHDSSSLQPPHRNMPPPHLVIHYHRLQNDYANWQIQFFSSDTRVQLDPTYTLCQLPKPSRTAYGLIFRFPLQPLPTSLGLLPILPPGPFDYPARYITLSKTNTDLHLFLIQGDPNAYTDLTQLAHRFLPVSIPDPSPSTWLIAITDSAIKRDVFPATSHHRLTPSLCLIDLHHFRGASRLRVVRVDSHDDALCIQSPSAANTTVQLPSESSHLIFEGNELKPLQTHPLHALLVEQADRFVYLSKVKEKPPTPSPLPVAAEPTRNAILRVYVKRLNNDIAQVLLSAWAEDGKSLACTREPHTHQSAAVFSIDVSDVNKLHLTVTSPEKLESKYVWMAAQGLHITLAETFPQVWTRAQANRSIFYYRYGDFSDWRDWELHIWSEATAEYPAFSTMLKPERPPRPGVVWFDLGEVLFPKGAVVRAEPVRMSMFPGHMLVNEYGQEYQGEPYLDSSLRDVTREWICGKEPVVMHFWQGEPEVRSSAPKVEDMRRQSKIRLRYRRHMPDDYEGWDLWTWDKTDASTSRTAVKPEEGSVTRAWADFVLDRSLYGGGKCIFVVPRKGGDDWEERDEPARKWTAGLMDEAEVGLQVAVTTQGASGAQRLEPGGRDASEENLPSFLIVQGTHAIFKSLDHLKSMLEAYVDTENSIVVKAPVPIAWISPPRRGRAQSISDTELKFCETAGRELLASGCGINDVSGKTLRFRKVQQVSHTESRIVFDPNVVTFHEDFLVENVLVSVPGFATVALEWRRHEDWDKYLYQGNLGLEYERRKCSFRCFAPTADAVSVVLYNAPTGEQGRKVVRMRRIPEGCWKAIVLGNLKGRYYKLLAQGNNKRLFPGVEVMDPYSRCNTGHTGRGLIFGTENTKICPRPNIRPSEAIIYELHIRDVTIDKESGISKRGKFLGLAERGTKMASPNAKEMPHLTPWKQEPLPSAEERMRTLEKLSTGLDHIVQMGVNTIQILPIQDFDNDEEDDSSYRWGYMPVHFNSPDGWYASSTTSVARVTEFKLLVDAIHRAGLKVVMDVVYNHTAEDSNEFNLDARFSFNGLAPRYYYRTCGNTPVAHTGDSTCGLRKPNEDRCGECYSNGSGCGNEFRSESPMGRKFIIDSLKYWVNEYQVDGFRFDLLGLIDVETLEIASAELRKIDENIMVYGEPWAGGLSPIKITEKGAQRSKGFGVFNNTFRDAIRGSPFGAEETFVMDGGRLAEVKGGVIGSVDDFCDIPLETINYVECHDNYTLWDHMRFYIRSRTDDIKFTTSDMKRMDRLAAAVIFTSQGVPFMQAGQEMCRTKFDVENSYESPDNINMIRWKSKISEWNTVLYYRGLIMLRRAHPEIFCKETAEEIHESILFYEDLGLSVPDRCIAYRVCGNQEKLRNRLRRECANRDSDEEYISEESLKWTAVLVLFNPTPSEVEFPLPEQSTDGIWIQIVDATSAGTRPLRSPIIGSLSVQGRSAALLRRASKNEEDGFQLQQRLAAVTDSYCTFHGDNPLSRYAVGLETEISEHEAELQKSLKTRRREFERTRTRTARQRRTIPS